MGEDDLHAGRALAVGGSGSGGAAVATVLGHGPQTPMRQVKETLAGRALRLYGCVSVSRSLLHATILPLRQCEQVVHEC